MIPGSACVGFPSLPQEIRANTSKLVVNMVSGLQTWAGDLKTVEQNPLCLTEQASSWDQQNAVGEWDLPAGLRSTVQVSAWMVLSCQEFFPHGLCRVSSHLPWQARQCGGLSRQIRAADRPCWGQGQDVKAQFPSESHPSPVWWGCALVGGFGMKLQEQGAGLTALAWPWAACSATCTAGEAPALPGSPLWTDLTDVELRTRWGKEAGQHCPVVLCAFSERLRVRVPHPSGLLGMFLGGHHVWKLTQCCFDSAIQWPQFLYCGTLDSMENKRSDVFNQCK